MNKLKGVVLIRFRRIEEARECIEHADELGCMTIKDVDSPNSSWIDLMTHPVSPQGSPSKTLSKGQTTNRVDKVTQGTAQSTNLKAMEEYVRTYTSDQNFFTASNHPLIS